MTDDRYSTLLEEFKRLSGLSPDLLSILIRDGRAPTVKDYCAVQFWEFEPPEELDPEDQRVLDILAELNAMDAARDAT